ncbi:MAG: gephyrin-like molybdotransferase Glp [Rhizobiaceae bacterium]
MKPLITVAQALTQVLAEAKPLPGEDTALHDAAWRVLANDIVALRTQPPFPAAAMDGYALTDADARQGAELDVIGESAAGRRFAGKVQAGQAVRIFTGAPVPEGAGSIVMQEDVERLDGARIRIAVPVQPARHVRVRGLDFAEGQTLLGAGTKLDAATLSLAAAAGHATVPVHCQPVVALIATGDELVSPGQPTGPDQIVASNGFGIAALARNAGATVIDLGIVPDDKSKISAAVSKAVADGADILVTLGGASVGDHDLIRPVLADLGITLDFWQIAMRPGKPLMHARFGKTHVLGLPGNPVSSLVCAHLFLLPLIAQLAGGLHVTPMAKAILGAPMRENDKRQDYVRAEIARAADGSFTATPFAVQDSSMLAVLAKSGGLIIRPPFAPAANAGDTVDVLMLR